MPVVHKWSTEKASACRHFLVGPKWPLPRRLDLRGSSGVGFGVDLSLQMTKNDNIAYRIEYMHAFVKYLFAKFERFFLFYDWNIISNLI
ncbi:MAG: hypothetical protein EBZ47_06905 [Chlamydiae bacterium]|nr:hypothetical protein [Chlamydiota bacterium]